MHALAAEGAITTPSKLAEISLQVVTKTTADFTVTESTGMWQGDIVISDCSGEFIVKLGVHPLWR
jgi:hypothetical protein